MPIFSFACSGCHAESSHLLPYAQMRTAALACGACGGSLAYAGLSAPTVGREQRFGAILADGTRVRGNLNKSAPRRRAP